MDGIEGLGSFYLGKPYDADSKALGDGYVLYDSKDLTTHAVCVGMTGSGKTGLCVGVIEEAALDGVPSIVIDPKGDLADLMLTFPALRPEDFRPWINEDDAAKAGVSPDDYARSQAAMWSKGLADWGQDGARIQRLRDAADFAIYTPGSDAGLPVSVLGSFAPPADRSDAEAVGDQIGAIATGLLALLGIDADPIKSREHILISSILGAAWANGQALDIASLIAQIQQPPFAKIGVLDLDSFYPQKDRFYLALSLNNLLAAPGFQLWMQGVPLDIGQLLRTSAGKPRVAIFSIAHLSDDERMFFVTLLLNAVLSWMRSQSGTTSLRALLYMDEIFGFFPPTSEPPSKKPLLTLLKQARAFGLGVMLATQNPVDLDYKGLSNAGTWLIGRLQTDQDKQRVLDGLEGASGQGGLDRGQLEKLISALGNRVFLLNNVHENAPEVFQTRWTMSYLRGPLSRPQIASLMGPLKAALPPPAAAAAPVAGAPAAAGAATAAAPVAVAAATAPALPSGIAPAYLPLRGAAPAGATLAYVPALIGVARVRLLDQKSQVDESSDNARLAAFADGPIAIDWNGASDLAVAAADLESTPRDGASFHDLPAPARDAKSYAHWSKDYADWLYQTETVQLFRSPSQKLVSHPGESEADFRSRLAQGSREGRDSQADALRAKYDAKVAALQSKLHTAQQAVDREQNQERGAGLQTAVSVAGSILGGFLGRKSVSVSSITSAARGAGRVAQQHDDVARAEENVKLLQGQLADLQASFAQDAAGVGPDGAATEQLENVVIRPKKADIDVTLVTLAFAPHWQAAGGALTPAY